MNCIDNECKHLYSEMGEMFCELTHEEVPDNIDEIQCEHYLQARTCIDCVYSKTTIYETGTIDDIEYRCPFQSNKLIYDDSNAMNRHYLDVPECNIDKFENVSGE